MRPLSLRLKGFKGILDGLGLEEVTLNVADLRGLVAFVGDNGTGKTTLLDNLQPHRLMPSKVKDGKYSPGACDLYGEVYCPAEKDLIFEMDDGQKWRSKLFINPEAGKQEAYLYQEVDGEWKDKNKSGKVSTYDRAIEELVGSPQLFFNSVFRCQEAPRLNTYRKGVIKDILADLLLLENIKEKGKTAKAVVDTLCQLIDRVKAQETLLAPEAGRIPELVGLLKEASTILTKATADLGKAELTEKEVSDRLRSVEREIAQFTSTEDTRKKTAARVTNVEQVLRDLCTKRVGMENRQYDCHVNYLTKRTRLNKILANGAEIRKKVIEETSLVKQKENIEASLKTTREAIQQARQYADEATVLKDRLNPFQVKQAQNKAAHQSRVTALESEIKRIEESVKRLVDLPCGESMQGSCPAVRAAVEDRNRLAAAKTELAELNTRTGEDTAIAKEISTLLSKIDDLQQKTDSKSSEMRIVKLDAELLTVIAAISQANRFTRLLPELETAETALAELELEQKSALATHVSDLMVSFAEEDKADEELVDVKGALADLDITLLAAQDAEARKTAIGTELAGIKESIGGHRKDLMAANSKVAGLKESLDNAEKAAASLQAIHQKLSAIQEKRDMWAVIERGFGTDGIIALEIDDSGPEIARLANELLTSSFGPQYSVRINTQDMTADGKMTEVFDIKVITNDSGQESSLSDKSGGQKCWLEDAITKSIALFNAERSGKRFYTLFTDERDGALSQDAKRDFFVLKTKALERGGFVNEFFISHSPNASAMAHHRLLFKKGVGIVLEGGIN